MAFREGGYYLVAALDFGTTFSGYACSFRDDPEKIMCNKNWGEPVGFTSYKTPTSVLTNGKGKFITMGYDAEQQYNDSIGGGTDLQLYRHFKMTLHNEKEVSHKSVVCSVEGTLRPAVEIFGFAIRFLRKHIQHEINAKVTKKLTASDILWVITVPAIWSEPAKQFMREAAKRGGLIRGTGADNLTLALEPEAASLCCRRPVLAGYRPNEDATFPTNTKYLVLDCGGGTVDITAHKMVRGGKIEEIVPASGGPWGGIYIDRAFSDLLEEVFGKEFINHYKLTHPQGWFQLISLFEMAKKGFNAKDKKEIRITLPFTFCTFSIPRSTESSSDANALPIDRRVKKFGNPDVLFSYGIFIVRNDAAKLLFTPTFTKITSHVQHLLQNQLLRDCAYIFMVGGLSENKFLQNEIKQQFGSKGTKVFIPSEAQLAVLKGATLFGHYPAEIKTRIARKTYGYKVRDRFNSAIHDEQQKFTGADGEVWCTNIFCPVVKKGTPISVGQTIERSLYPSRNDGTSRLHIFSIDGQPRQPVQYVDAAEVHRLGEVVTKIRQFRNWRNHRMTKIFTFGSTEIHVKSILEETKEEFETSIDFLSEPSLD